MRKSLLVLSFTVLSFAPAWAAHEGSGLAVPPGPGARGGVVAVSHPLAAEAGARITAQRPGHIDLATGHQYRAVDSTRQGGLLSLPKGHRGIEHDDDSN